MARTGSWTEDLNTSPKVSRAIVSDVDPASWTIDQAIKIYEVVGYVNSSASGLTASLNFKAPIVSLETQAGITYGAEHRKLCVLIPAGEIIQVAMSGVPASGQLVVWWDYA